MTKVAKTFTQYRTRIRRGDAWCQALERNDGTYVPHPGWDAYDVDYDKDGNSIPGSFRRNPEKDREPTE